MAADSIIGITFTDTLRPISVDRDSPVRAASARTAYQLTKHAPERRSCAIGVCTIRTSPPARTRKAISVNQLEKDFRAAPESARFAQSVGF